MSTIEHLSFSSMSTFDRCGLQFYFRYAKGLKIPPSGALIQGKSFDRAEQLNFSQKIETKKDVPTENVTDIFSSTYDSEIKDAKLEDGEDPGELKDIGIRTLVKFHEVRAPEIQPVTVQEKNEINISGTNLLSFMDLVDEKESIHDLKTASKSPSKEAAETSLQLTSYDYTFRKTRGHVPNELVLDYAVKTKEPKIVVVNSPARSETQIQAFEEEVALKREAIEKGVFLPAAMDSWVCSEKWCGYFHLCAFGAKRRNR